MAEEKSKSNMRNIDKGKTVIPDKAISVSEQQKKQFKKELMDLFQKYGYLLKEKDHEIRIKTTSGNIAWININIIETIK